MAECSACERGNDEEEKLREEFQQQLQEAIDASLDDHALQLQVEEVIAFSDAEYACELQMEEVLKASAASCPPHMGSSSSSNPSSSSPPQCLQEFIEEFYLNQDVRAKRPISDCTLGQTSKRPRILGKEVVEEVFCGICLEAKSPSEIFDNMVCFHRFCSNCIVQHILIKRQEKVATIQCPQSDCGEHLTPGDCRIILLPETYEKWCAALAEADIPESQKFSCPYSDCRAVLWKEEQGIESSTGAPIKQSECPECRRLFCAQCGVSWHAGLDCSDFQKLSPSEKEKDDLMLLSLAKEKQWQRCAQCKQMVEKESGCCHMTCRCGFEFCYKCGSEWKHAGVPCNCPGWEE